jgi:hypothetical protein
VDTRDDDPWGRSLFDHNRLDEVTKIKKMKLDSMASF